MEPYVIPFLNAKSSMHMFLTEALSGVVSIERTSRKEVDALIGALINLEIASHLIADICTDIFISC